MTLLGWVILSGPALADSSIDKTLAECLERAEQSPDLALAEADRWLKEGGGDPARLCRAYAQFHRGEYLLAAQAFRALADSTYKQQPNNTKHVAALAAQAGLAYARANDVKNAEIAYAAAIKLEAQDPDIWLDRATMRADAERYWDALDDLNRALTLMPDQPQALRLRGQVWTKLGHESNARADFIRAAMLDGQQPEP